MKVSRNLSYTFLDIVTAKPQTGHINGLKEKKKKKLLHDD